MWHQVKTAADGAGAVLPMLPVPKPDYIRPFIKSATNGSSAVSHQTSSSALTTLAATESRQKRHKIINYE